MENQAKNSPFNAGLVAICSFIGVGFITGAEIWFYFARFGAALVFGVAIFAVLMVFLIVFALRPSETLSQKFLRFKRAIFAVSELLIASAMMSGLLETTKMLFSKAWLLVFLAAILVVCLLFYNNIKSFVIYNYFVAGFVIFVATFLLLNNNYNSVSLDIDLGYKNITKSILFAALYVFMNIAEMRPIFNSVQGLKSKKRKYIFAICISLTLALFVILFGFTLFCNKDLTQFSMPFLLLFKNNGGAVYYIFLAGLVLAMISTAESCLIGANSRINLSKNDENFAKSVVIISSLILGQLPFTFFVRIVYPFIAGLNALLFVCEVRKGYTR